MTDLRARLKSAARVWHDAGCCVIPARADGSKAPFGEWEEFQSRRATLAEIDGWLDSGQYDGIGIVCGAVSGELEMFEIEGRFADEGGYDALGMAMIEAGHADLWHALCTGYLERTPSGGFHWIYRVDDGPALPNLKLARRPSTPAEIAANPDDKVKVLIETRGEGGFTITAPSGGRTHPEGKAWEWVSGKPADIPVLTAAERDALHASARTFDSMPVKERKARQEPRERREGDPLRPGDDYNDRKDWGELLEGYHWTWVRTLRDGSEAWRRPGKTDGISATVGYGDTDLLHVFSSSAYPLESEESYSKFGVYAEHEHGGDYGAAAQALALEGYGNPLWADPVFGAAGTVYDAFQATGQPVVAVEPDEVVEAPPKMTLHEQMVAKELAVLRAREEARALYEQEKAVSLFRVPPSTRTLAEELTLPDEPVEYAIAELLPVGGNALLTAQYKSGKTTVLGEAARAFADGTPFLGRFEMNPAPGRIAIFNYELSPAQYRRWLRELNIRNTDRVAVLHLRGFRLDLRTQFGQDWCVRWLEEREVSMWAPDPFARAATGVEENSNSEAGEWLDMVDIIKERAGVRDLILPNHTGREKQEQGEERGRGATRLDDWADVRWILTKDKDGNRFFRATGRDVEVGEERLTYDESDRSLRFGGGDKRRVAEDALDRLVVEWVAGHPGSNQTEVERGVEGKAVEIRASLKRCVRLHRLRVEDGPRHALLYTANL